MKFNRIVTLPIVALVVLISISQTGCEKSNIPQQMHEETDSETESVHTLEPTDFGGPTDPTESVESDEAEKAEKQDNIKSSTASDQVENQDGSNLVKNWSEPTLVEDRSKSGQNSITKESLEEQLEKINKINTTQFYGSWKLWIPGGMTDWYSKQTGEFVTGEYNPGAYAGTVSVNKNGTYSMDQIVWGNGAVKGKWRLPKPGELKHDQAIVLVNGAGGTDWAVVASPEGEVNLFRKSVYNNVVYWYFDTNMNKK